MYYFMVIAWKKLQWSGHNQYLQKNQYFTIYQAVQRQLIWPKKSVPHSGQLFSNLVFHIPSEDFFYLKRYISLLLFKYNLVY